jgi:4-hydroxy-tetrahydrodipicolinate reductase
MRSVTFSETDRAAAAAVAEPAERAGLTVLTPDDYGVRRNRTIKYGIVGYSGRMGNEISDAFSSRGHELVCTVDVGGETIRDIPDVIIDFSRPAALSATLRICRECSSALVLGTTGLSESDVASVRELSDAVPVVHSSNFAIGINILGKILSDYANILGDWEMEMEEMHHDKKKDAPSGTALSLMAQAGRTCPAHSYRLGNLYGDHAIYFSNGDELLTFSHRAVNRSIYAWGALRAAEFAVGAENGYYSFKDVLCNK